MPKSDMGCSQSRDTSAVPAGVLLGVGNPLLDVSANADKKMVDKYGLKMNNAILAEEKHMPIYAELAAKEDVEYIAGGATQNSIRVAQWMLQAQGATSYIGCVGDDDYAKKLKECAEGDGVKTYYLTDKKTPTGTCACLIMDKERSLVANLSAANNYKVDHMKGPGSPVYEKAGVIYMAGFFITVSPDTIALIREHSLETKKTFCMNISAPFIVQVPPFQKVLKESMPYLDILFGNESEAAAFGQMMKYKETEVAEIALRASQEESKPGKSRMVVITQGSSATVVAYENKVTRYAVPKLDQSSIVDSNGAGDAFVGGFLAMRVKGADVATCVDAGHFAAQTIIQTSGTKISKQAPGYKPAKAQPIADEQ